MIMFLLVFYVEYNYMQRTDMNMDIIYDWLYILSHLIFTIIVVICLRKYKPLLTFFILSIILAYICHLTKDKYPLYTMPLIGFCIFLVNIWVQKVEYNETSKNFQWTVYLENELWTIPFWGILSFYGLYILSNTLFAKPAK